MKEQEMGLGRMFIYELVKAGAWGIVLMLVLGMFILTIKQDIKEGIAYGIDRAFTRAVMIGTDPYLIGKAKQLVKEGVEYSIEKTGKETRAILEEQISKAEEKRK